MPDGDHHERGGKGEGCEAEDPEPAVGVGHHEGQRSRGDVVQGEPAEALPPHGDGIDAFGKPHGGAEEPEVDRQEDAGGRQRREESGEGTDEACGHRLVDECRRDGSEAERARVERRAVQHSPTSGRG